MAIKGPGLQLGGSASLEGGPARIHFDLGGPLLDLKTLLHAIPKRKEAARATRHRTGVIPLAARQKLEAIQADGRLSFDRVESGRLKLNQFQAHAVLASGRLELDDARAGIFHGTVDASGSGVTLDGQVPEWKLRARLRNVQLGPAMAQLSAHPPPLEGRVDANLSLQGRGDSWSAVEPNLHGNGSLKVHDGVLTTGNLEGSASGGGKGRKLRMIGKGLRAIGGAGSAGTAPGSTRLGELSGTFVVREKGIHFEEPLTLDAPFGNVRLEGRVGLDKQLDLHGDVDLPPTIAARIFGSVVMRRPGATDVPLQLGGTLDQPSFRLSRGRRPRRRARRGCGARRPERPSGEEVSWRRSQRYGFRTSAPGASCMRPRRRSGP
jgi:AsmA protein